LHVTDTVIFVLTWLLVTFHLSGYVALLILIRLLRPRALVMGLLPAEDLDCPDCYVCIPTFNERDHIREKIANTAALQYPDDRKHILVIDGGSSDGTVETVREMIDRDGVPGLRLLTSDATGKIAQLNEALAAVHADALVVVSDADALVEYSPALLKTVSIFRQNEEIGVIGGWTVPDPAKSLPAEDAYWDKQNRLRYVETKAFSSSIVTAPYYAFTRRLLPSFPADCVHDDVYIAFAAHWRDKRVVVDPDIVVREIRNPLTFRELFLHKLRKVNGWCYELFRSAYRLPHMGARLKVLTLFKLFQFLFLPWVIPVFFIETIVLLLGGHLVLVGAFYAVLLISTLATSLVIVPPPGRERGGLRLQAITSTVVFFVMIHLALMVNTFVYPFWAQTANYRKAS